MLNLFKKTIRKNMIAAVCPDQNGIAIAKIRRDKDVPPVLEFCSYEKLNEENHSDLAKLVKSNHLDELVSTSVIAFGDYSLLMVEAPDVQPEELRSAVRWRIKDLIDFHIDDAVIDVFEVPNLKTTGTNRMMYVVAARSEQVKRQIDRLVKAGLNLDIIDIPELALRNIAAILPEDVGGVALVYIGQKSGLITITRQETLYLSRRIETGLDDLPETAIHTGDEQVIESWLDGIVIEIQRSLDYYESHFSLPQVSGLVLAPTGRNLPKAGVYLSSQLGLPARQFDINELIDMPEEIDMQVQSDCLLAIGAALRQESMAL